MSIVFRSNQLVLSNYHVRRVAVRVRYGAAGAENVNVGARRRHERRDGWRRWRGAARRQDRDGTQSAVGTRGVEGGSARGTAVATVYDAQVYWSSVDVDLVDSLNAAASRSRREDTFKLSGQIVRQRRETVREPRAVERATRRAALNSAGATRN